MRKLSGESGAIPSSAGLTPKLWHHGRSESSLSAKCCTSLRLSEQPLPVPFPVPIHSNNDCFSCPTRHSLAQVFSVASSSPPFMSGESVSFILLQAAAGSKKPSLCRCLCGWCRICPSGPGLCWTSGDAPRCQLWLPAAVICHQSEAAALPVTNQPWQQALPSAVPQPELPISSLGRLFLHSDGPASFPLIFQVYPSIPSLSSLAVRILCKRLCKSLPRIGNRTCCALSLLQKGGISGWLGRVCPW